MATAQELMALAAAHPWLSLTALVVAGILVLERESVLAWLRRTPGGRAAVRAVAGVRWVRSGLGRLRRLLGRVTGAVGALRRRLPGRLGGG